MTNEELRLAVGGRSAMAVSERATLAVGNDGLRWRSALWVGGWGKNIIAVGDYSAVTH